MRDAGACSDVPILLIYAGWLAPDSISSRYKSYTAKNPELRKIYGRLLAAGDENLYYIRAEELLGDDAEGTVDGIHPTDLGFLRMSQTIARVLHPLLPR